MSLVQFFRILYARRVILLVALLSAVFAGAVMIKVLPKRYSASARLIVDVVKPDPVTGQVLGTQFMRSYTKTQIELIKDYQTAGKVVDKLGWTSNPEIVQAYAVQSGGRGDTEGMRRWLAGQISSNTNAGFLEASNILQITFQGPNPDTARRIVTVIREVYLDDILSTKRASAGETADWLREQAATAEALVKTAEAERARYARENGIILQADNTDLESSRLRQLAGQSASASATAPLTITTGGGAAGVSSTQVQLDTVTQQIAQAGQSLGPNHPNYQALLRQKSVLEGLAARERVAMARAASGAGPIGPDPAARADAAYEQQKQKVVAQSGTVDIINRMTRDIELKRDQLSKLNDRANDLRLSANVVDSGMSPLGDATSSGSPDFPKVPLVVAGSIGFGLALGVVIALLIEMVGRRVRSHDDLERAVAAPVFAEIAARPKKLGAARKLAQRLLERTRPRPAFAVSAE